MSQLLRPLFRGAQCQQARLISISLSLQTERGVNKVQLMGRVGNVPRDFTNPTSGRKLVAFPLATSTSFRTKDAEGNETTSDKTTWHSINVFKPFLQDVVMKLVQKGSRVYINGRLSNTKYVKDGTEKYVTAVIADDLIHLQSPRSSMPDNESFQQENKFQQDNNFQQGEPNSSLSLNMDAVPQEEREPNSSLSLNMDAVPQEEQEPNSSLSLNMDAVPQEEREPNSSLSLNMDAEEPM